MSCMSRVKKANFWVWFVCLYLCVSERAAAAGDVGGGVVGAGATLSLLLVDAVSFSLW